MVLSRLQLPAEEVRFHGPHSPGLTSETATARLAARCSTLLLICGLVAPSSLLAKGLYGTITAIESADHFVLDYGAGRYDVRLFGVDAPLAGAAFALEGKLRMQQLALGREARLYIQTRNDQSEMVAMVWVDGVDLTVTLIREGLARRAPDAHYRSDEPGEPDALVAAEEEALQSGRGLWARTRSNDTEDDEIAPATVLGPAPAGTIDRNLSQKSGNDSECAIAKDPSNPLRLFASCNTASNGLVASRSTDGGESWTYPDPADKTIADGDLGQGVAACCDPTQAWDSYGNLFVTYIRSNLNAIITLVSTDGGLTFTEVGNFTGSIDQPTVVAESTTGGVTVWVVWNQNGSMVARGAAVSGLGAVGAFNALQTIPGSFGCSFGDIAIAPSGAVVQTCQIPTGGEGPATIFVNTDPDGLGSDPFGSAVAVTSTNVGGFDFLPAQAGRSVDAEAGLAYDRKPGSPHFGRLYLVYTDEVVAEGNDMDISLRSPTTTAPPGAPRNGSTTTAQAVASSCPRSPPTRLAARSPSAGTTAATTPPTSPQSCGAQRRPRPDHRRSSAPTSWSATAPRPRMVWGSSSATTWGSPSSTGPPTRCGATSPTAPATTRMARVDSTPTPTAPSGRRSLRTALSQATPRPGRHSPAPPTPSGRGPR